MNYWLNKRRCKTDYFLTVDRAVTGLKVTIEEAGPGYFTLQSTNEAAALLHYAPSRPAWAGWGSLWLSNPKDTVLKCMSFFVWMGSFQQVTKDTLRFRMNYGTSTFYNCVMDDFLPIREVK